MAFFTTDDLVRLQQAAGLRHVLPTPARFLSEVLYFRVMVSLFGLNPLLFHLVPWALHFINAALLFGLFRRSGARSVTAGFAVTLFACLPLARPVLCAAVGVNDELALAFTVIAIRLAWEGGAWRMAGACFVFSCATLSKESVVCLPAIVLLLRSPGESLRRGVARAAPLLTVAAAFAIMFVVLQRAGLASAAPAYSVHFGANVFHNLMTYTAWSVDLSNPIPDIVGSYDRGDWRIAVPVLGSLFLAWWWCRSQRHTIQVGVCWWWLGLMPVLGLEHRTYAHYLHPAVPGLALAVATTVGCLLSRLRVPSLKPLAAGAFDDTQTSSWPDLAGPVLLTLLSVAYAVRADHLLEERMAARVPGTGLALDPLLRRQEVAQEALASIIRFIRPGQRWIVIYTPEGTERVFGSQTGQERRPRPGRQSYNLLEEALDHGRAVRLFCPQVDSVAFIRRWSRAYGDFQVFLPVGGGYLRSVGTGRAAHAELSGWMLENGWYAQAKQYLEEVLVAYPDDASLRFAYSGALVKTGDRSKALHQLEEIVQRTPRDSLAVLARLILQREATKDSP